MIGHLICELRRFHCLVSKILREQFGNARYSQIPIPPSSGDIHKNFVLIESSTCRLSEISKLGTNQIGGEVPDVNILSKNENLTLQIFCNHMFNIR